MEIILKADEKQSTASISIAPIASAIGHFPLTRELLKLRMCIAPLVTYVTDVLKTMPKHICYFIHLITTTLLNYLFCFCCLTLMHS